MQDSNALVLEISKLNSILAMSIFQQRELVSTVRHYSQCLISSPEVNKLCLEIISILNKTNRKGILEIDSVDSLKKTGQLLWDQLFTRAVKDRLKASPSQDLILSLDEELIPIPWELLYDGSDFLCLRFNLGRVVRTKERSSPPQYRSFQGKLKMLILANPTNDLKSAYLEGVFIKNQFDKKRRELNIDFKSTNIDTLYVKKNLRDYDIVHFAGHCEYDSDEPKNSGWTLSDARFTARDIYALGETLSLPTLIFSNACHSAKFRGGSLDIDYQEKLYSLASAFLFSGVRHYIGTICKIEDELGLSFAKEFYTQLISGKSVGECVRLGRLKLIREYGITAIVWMSYLLYGDPNFVLFTPPRVQGAGFRAKVEPLSVKTKRVFSLYKKPLKMLALIISIIFVCIYLYIWLPTLNPNTYRLFLKSRNLFLKGKNEEVVLLCKRIIEKEPQFLAVYPLLADTYQRLGRFDEALKYYFTYALYSEKKNDKKNLASAYKGIGWVYHLRGEYAKAFDFYNQAITLSRKNKDKLNEATALRKLAVWYMDNQDYDKALELLTKSSEINRERQESNEHRYNLACDYFNIALVFSNKDDFATARKFYTKSAHLFEKLKLKNELSDCYFNLGETYLFEKQYQKAQEFYLRGLEIDLAEGDIPRIASDYNMFGELYVEMDNLDEAEKFFNRSVSVAKQIDARPELASAYYNLGLLYKKKSQKNKAREFLRLAQEIYRNIDPAIYQEIKQLFLELNRD